MHLSGQDLEVSVRSDRVGVETPVLKGAPTSKIVQENAGAEEPASVVRNGYHEARKITT